MDRRGAKVDLPAKESGKYRLTLEADHGILTQLEERTITVDVDWGVDRARRATRTAINKLTPQADSILPPCKLAGRKLNSKRCLPAATGTPRKSPFTRRIGVNCPSTRACQPRW